MKIGNPADKRNVAGSEKASARPTAAAEASLRIMDAISTLVGEVRGEAPPAERYDLRAGRRLPRDWAGEAV